MHKIEQEQLFY